MASYVHLVFLLCLITVVSGSGKYAVVKPKVCICPSGWTRLGHRCFIFYGILKNWVDAEKYCISIGGNLASVHSPQEDMFLRILIHNSIGRHSHTWIGAHDAPKEDEWLWSDGSAFDYTRWSTGQPDNRKEEHCAEMNFRVRYWNDLKCQTRRPFVCVKKGH